VKEDNWTSKLLDKGRIHSPVNKQELFKESLQYKEKLKTFRKWKQQRRTWKRKYKFFRKQW
jgi:hypothetical protein